MNITYKSFFFLALISILSACDSSDSSNTTIATTPTPATLTATNLQDLSIAATESTKQAIASDSANFLAKTTNNIDSNKQITNKVKDIIFNKKSLGNLCIKGTYDDNIAQNNTSASGIITFTGCDIGGGITLEGTITFSGSSTSFTMVYNNLTITVLNEIQTLNATINCSTVNQETTCEIDTSITGIDGRTFKVNKITVSGNATNGYQVNATVIDPTHGTITVNANTMKFSCSAPNEGRPSSGNITFSSNGKTATIVFDSCSTYTATLDGVANSFTW